MISYDDEHAAFAASRTKQFTYVPPNEMLFPTLDQHSDVIEDVYKPPLVVAGDIGTGKSALLANWIEKRKEHLHKDEFLFQHYVSCSHRSSELQYTLHRLATSLKDHFQLREMEVPDTEERLRWGLNRFLAAAAKKYSSARIIIVIDGINKMQCENSQEGSLHWLPIDLPNCVRIIVSTIELDENGTVNKTFEELSRRKCPLLRMDTLSINVRQKIISNYIEYIAPELELSETDQFKIVTIPQATQPLYLRFLLQSLRMEYLLGRIPSTFAHLIDAFARSDTAFDLINKTLSISLNDEYLSNLQYMLCSIYVSRDGLSSSEMFGLLSLMLQDNSSPETRDKMMIVIHELTMLVESRHSFTHSTYFEVIYKRFIVNNNRLISLHLDMARYFTQLPASPRKLVCLPYHLQIAGLWSKVKNCLTDISNFQLWWTPSFKSDFISFWASLTVKHDELRIGTERPTFDIVDEYVKSLEEYRIKMKPDYELLSVIILDIADFLLEFATLGHETGADVPAYVHPLIPSADLKTIGIPHITVEDGRSILWYPSIFSSITGIGEEGAKKNENDGGEQKRTSVKAVEDIPQRSMYYFSRWMWIQFPAIALGNTKQRFKHGIKDKEEDPTSASYSRRPQTSSNAIKSVDIDVGNSTVDVGDESMKDIVAKLARSIGFRPKTSGPTGGHIPEDAKKSARAFKLPQIKFRRKAARSFRKVPLEDKSEDISAGKIEQRMTSLRDSIQSYREEFDFLYQQKLSLQNQLYQLRGSLVTLQNAGDSMGMFDDEFISAGHKSMESTEKWEDSKLEQNNLKNLLKMCVRHPPHMPALIESIENKIEQDVQLLAECRKRLFEQHFEHETHKTYFKEMKNLAATGVEMHNKLLDLRYKAQKKMQSNALKDMNAMNLSKTGDKNHNHAGSLAVNVDGLINDSTFNKLGDNLSTDNISDVNLISNVNDGGDSNGIDDEDSLANIAWGDLSVWMNAWNMISYRTGITEPEVFFQRLEGRKTLESQMYALKKMADTRLENLKIELVDVESELEETGYDANFIGGKGQDQSQRKRDMITATAKLKHSKERANTYEKLRKDSIEGLRHVAEILGQHPTTPADSGVDRVNINDIIRDVEIAVDALLEEFQRVETASAEDNKTNSQSQSLSMIDNNKSPYGKENMDNGAQVVTRPEILNNALTQIETFRPRIPSRLPSKFVDNIGIMHRQREVFDTSVHDRETMKASATKFVRGERIKQAKREKEAADLLLQAS